MRATSGSVPRQTHPKHAAANPWYLPAITAIALIAAALRLYKLGDANIWEDEARTVWFQHFDVAHILFATAGDTHPPLSYILYHYWQLPSGSSAFALRFLAAAFGIATVPVCAAIGRHLAGPTAGTITALLLAVAPFHVWWSEQIRMYSLIALLASISIFCFLAGMRFREQQPARARWLLVGMAIANLAGLYSLYFYVLIIVLESLFVLGILLRRHSATLFVWWTSIHLASILAFLPWLSYFREHAITFSARAVPRPTPSQFVEGSWSELILGIDVNVDRFRLLNLILAALAVGLLALLLIRGRRWPVACWLALIVVSVPLIAYVITLPQGLFFSPTYQTRYQLMALPALVVLFGWGIASLPRSARSVPLLGLLAVSGFSLTSLYQDRHLVDDYQSLARFIQAYEQPGDAIVIDPDSDAELFLFSYNGQLPWQGLPTDVQLDAGKTDEYFSNWARTAKSMWLLQIAGGHDAGATHPVHDWLNGHFRETMSLSAGNKLAVLYEPPGAATRTLTATFAPLQPLAAPAGLQGYDQILQDVRPGDILNVAVYGPLAANAKLSLASAVFPGRAFPGQTRFALPISAATPAGELPIALIPSSGPAIPMSSVHVESHQPPAAPVPVPVLPRPVNRSFGGSAIITSYNVSSSPTSPGQPLTITLQWQDQQPFSDDYTVFVHLLDSANNVIAQRDSQPQDGKNPTVQWTPGQTIDDPYQLTLPPSIKPGDYGIEVGLYLQSTGERLHLADAPTEDHLIVGTVTVR